MQKKYINEHVQTLVDIIYYRAYTKCDEDLKKYITNGNIEVASTEDDEIRLPIYDSMIYPDFLPSKYFNAYTLEEHIAIEKYFASVDDIEKIKTIKVYNVFRLTQEIRYHLAHFLHSCFDQVDHHSDEKNFDFFQFKLNFVLEHIDFQYQIEYERMWKNIVNLLSCEKTVESTVEQKLLSSHIDKEVILRLRNSFSKTN